MKIKINREALANAIGSVAFLAKKATTLPILKFALFEIKSGQLRLTTTDLNSEVSFSFGVGEDASNIKVALPATRVLDLVKSFDGDDIEIDFDSSESPKASFVCGKSKFNIAGLDAADFPPSLRNKEADVLEKITLSDSKDQESFLSSLGRAIISAEKTAKRPLLNAVFLQKDGNRGAVCGTDGKRMFLNGTNAVSPSKSGRILPLAVVSDVYNSLKQFGGPITIEFGENFVLFKRGDLAFFAHVIEGNYPDLSPILKKNAPNCALVKEPAALSKVLRRAEILLKQDRLGAKFNFSRNKLTISGQSEGSDFSEDIEIDYNGSDLSVVFSPIYFREGLTDFNEEVRLKFDDGSGPFFFECGEEYVYVLMPMRAN